MKIVTTNIAAFALLALAGCEVAQEKNEVAENAQVVQDTTLRINCFFKVAPENRDSVLAAAKRLTEASLKQDGCIAYDIFESATDPGSLMICETWRDQTALDAHSASEVFKTEVGIITPLTEKQTDIFKMP